MNALNFIGGVFIDAAEGETIPNINPATGGEIGTIARSKKADVESAVQAASKAQNDWSSRSMLERADWLDRIADGLEARKQELAQRESKDTGKPLSLARRVDAERSINNFRFFADFARQQEPEVFEMSDATNFVHRKPIGTVGLITPWNLPLYLLSWKVAPALLMGNTIVAKPSEMTPLTANLLCEVASEIGLPPGVLNVVHGYGQKSDKLSLNTLRFEPYRLLGEQPQDDMLLRLPPRCSRNSPWNWVERMQRLFSMMQIWMLLWMEPFGLDLPMADRCVCVVLESSSIVRLPISLPTDSSNRLMP